MNDNSTGCYNLIWLFFQVWRVRMARGVPRAPSAIRHSARRHGENVPGLFAAPVPPHLLLHTLSGTSGQSRWANLEGKSH